MEQELKELLEDLALRSFLSVSSVDITTEESGILKFMIKSDEPNIIIGKHGETLFAFQQVFRLLAERKFEGELPHMIVDVDGYRDHQVEQATVMAENAVSKMRRYGDTTYELPPMPSYKRRAVHFYIVENFDDIETSSTGVGQDRRIVLTLKEI